MLAASVSQSESKLIDLIEEKKVSTCFWSFHNSSQNNRCQVELICSDFNKMDDSGFDWKVCLWVAACVCVQSCGWWLIGHQAALTPQGAELWKIQTGDGERLWFYENTDAWSDKCS